MVSSYNGHFPQGYLKIIYTGQSQRTGAIDQTQKGNKQHWKYLGEKLEKLKKIKLP